MGHVVGFLGDGVNDAPAMHAADTSLSVEQAVDVAREAADFVLLERGLDVIRRGIEEGRKTFANTLQLAFLATPELFRTGWFVESLLTELVIALVVRTRRPFFRSRHGKVLLIATIGLIVVTFAMPYLPFASVFGFVPLPGTLVAAVSGITVLCVAATESTKRWLSVMRP